MISLVETCTTHVLHVLASCLNKLLFEHEEEVAMSPQAQVASSHTYSMRELNQNTAHVIREINESGEPALITRQGRPVALITPLANVRVEAAVLTAARESVSVLNTAESVGKIHTSEEVGRDLGFID